VLKTFVCCTCGVIISRMFINDNIHFNSKRNIIDNFPIESTPPTVFYPWWEFRDPEHCYGLLNGIPRTVWRNGIGDVSTQHLGGFRVM
jgi:hypothetical protein